MTAYPFLQKNIEYLQRIGHPVYQWLSTQDFKQEALLNNLFVNGYGLLDWRMENGKGLFEVMPPKGLYGSWLDSDKPETSATFIVGSNLGYGVNHVLQNTPDTHKVMLIEPRAEMLLACLGQTDYRPFFENKKFHLMIPNEDYIYEVIKNLDLQFIYGQLHLKGDLPSQQLGSEYARWTTILRNKMENFSLELSTLRFRQDVMVGNEINNFRKAMSDGSLKNMEGVAAGAGAMILGAGPSLEKFAPQLKESRNHVLHVSALQTLPVLQELGIKPHFCVAIDYDKSMLKLFERLDPDYASDIPLIYSTKLDPESVKRYTGPTIPMWTVGGIGTHVMQGHDLVIDAGGNVSVTISRLLRWCGVSHLLMVGQDYAWINGMSHATGHHGHTKSMKRRSCHQTTRNREGEEILTTVQYMTAKRELENDLRKSAFPIYNIYGGGALIDNTRTIDMETAHKQGILASAPGSVDRFMTALLQCRQQRLPITLEAQSPIWTNSMRNAEKHLAKLFKNVERNQQDIHETFQKIEGFIKASALYAPYLFNEIIDLAGLTRAKSRYTVKDFPEFKRIAKQILKKVREVDRKVCIQDTKQAVA